MKQAPVQAPKNGYAYIYVGNESDETVYFDNLQVTNNHGVILEEDHYYAYGLKIAGISSKVLPDPNGGFVQKTRTCITTRISSAGGDRGRDKEVVEGVGSGVIRVYD